jgi:hypothetical protein
VASLMLPTGPEAKLKQKLDELEAVVRARVLERRFGQVGPTTHTRAAPARSFIARLAARFFGAG